MLQGSKGDVASSHSSLDKMQYEWCWSW